MQIVAARNTKVEVFETAKGVIDTFDIDDVQSAILERHGQVGLVNALRPALDTAAPGGFIVCLQSGMAPPMLPGGGLSWKVAATLLSLR